MLSMLIFLLKGVDIMAFGNATKGYVKAHSGGGGSGTDNYNNLSNKPKINGVALSGNKTSADLHIETGTDDYEDLTNKPSINGVELLGENVIGLLSGNIQVDYTKLTDLPSINGVTLTGNKTSSDLHISGGGTTDYEDLSNKPSINGVELLGNNVIGLLSGNIQVDYTKLTDLPSINGVTLSGNKTSADLHISGSGTTDYDDLSNKPSINGVELLGDKVVGLLSGNIHVDYTKLTNTPSINGVKLTGNKTSSDLNISGLTTTTLWTNDGTHKEAYNGPFNLSANVTNFKFIKFIFKTGSLYSETTLPASVVSNMITNAERACNSFMYGNTYGEVSTWTSRTSAFAYLPSATTLKFDLMWDNANVKMTLWEVVGIN